MPSLRFTRRQRLTHAREFQGVFGARLRKVRGPLTVFGRANALGTARLGLSIGRAVGTAVRRARLKRHLREAFRMIQHDLPRHEAGGYDLVVGARAHDELGLDEYRGLLMEAARAIDADWRRRAAR